MVACTSRDPLPDAAAETLDLAIMVRWETNKYGYPYAAALFDFLLAFCKTNAYCCLARACALFKSTCQVDVYHHVEYPKTVCRRLRSLLRPGTGRLVVIDFHRDPVTL